MPLAGTLKLALSAADGGSVNAEADVDLGQAAGIDDPTIKAFVLEVGDQPLGHAAMKLRATRASGLLIDEATIEGEQLEIGPKAFPVRLTDFVLGYRRIGVDDVWDGRVSVAWGLGPPTPPGATAGLRFVNGRFGGAQLHFTDLNIPVPSPPAPPGIFFQDLGLAVIIRPSLEIAGTAGVSLGPTVLGLRALKLDATLTFKLRDACPGRRGNRPLILLEGTSELLGLLDGPSTYACYSASTHPGGESMVSFGGSYTLGLLGYALSVRGDGFIDGVRALTLTGVGELRMPGDSADRPASRARVLVSDRGISACTEDTLRIPAAAGSRPEDTTATVRIGFAYAWGQRGPPQRSCDIEQFKTVNVRSVIRRAVQTSAPQTTSTLLPDGLPTVAFAAVGRGAVPSVVIHPPSGRPIRVRAPKRRTSAPGYVAVTDAANHALYVVVAHPRPGRWRVGPLPGSPRSQILVARGLPAPSVAGALRRAGRDLVLDWAALDLRGQTIRFSEQGGDADVVLGESDKSSGSLRFTPQSGDGEHEVRALVQQGGLPRAELTVARFVSSGGASRVGLQAPLITGATGGRTLTVRLRNPNTARISGTVTAVTAERVKVARRERPASLGSARFALTAGGSRTVKLRLSSAVRTILRRIGTARVALRATARAGSGTVVRSRRVIEVRISQGARRG